MRKIWKITLAVDHPVAVDEKQLPAIECWAEREVRSCGDIFLESESGSNSDKDDKKEQRKNSYFKTRSEQIAVDVK